MKKTLAVILSIIMLVCCIPFSASAAEITKLESFRFGETTEGQNPDDTIATGDTVNIGDGQKVVVAEVPFGTTLYVSSNAKLIVKRNSTLKVNGSLVVLSGGYLEVQGSLMGADNIFTNGSGRACAEIRFPTLETSQGLIDGNGKSRINVSYAVSTTFDASEDLKPGFSANFDKESNKIGMGGTKILVDLKQYLYVKAEIAEPEGIHYDKYDDSKFDVYINSVSTPFSAGVHYTCVTTGIDISYGSWKEDSYYLNTFNIYLPQGEGYTVYGRGGEQSATGETVKLKCGQAFAFNVEIDPEYDMSSYEVYVYNGYGWTDLDTSTLLKDIAPAVPDDYGYYHIPEVTGEYTIYVVGVVKNETLLMVGDILDLVRNMFEMIRGFFEEIMAFFGISFGGNNAA